MTNQQHNYSNHTMTKYCLRLKCLGTHDSNLSFTISQFAHTHVHQVSEAIQLSHSLLPTSLPALNLSQHQGLFQWVTLLNWWPKCWSFSFSLSPSNENSGLISCRIDLVWTDSQEFSPAPQFESNNSALCLLYGPTLTSIHDYWKNHNLDYMDLCQQSDASAF